MPTTAGATAPGVERAAAFVPGQSAAVADRSLRRSLVAVDHARQCAVLWFAEIRRRRLYRELGYSSVNQYAARALGFSRSRTGDFVQLARKLDALPAVRQAVATGEVGYTKAREIVKVATPATEQRWLAAARGPRRVLVAEVKKAQRAARVDPAQGELVPAAATVVAARELPVRWAVELRPEQEARRAALVERLGKLRGVPADRAELLLEALAALVEVEEARWAEKRAGAARGAPVPGRPPVQIHAREREDGRLTVATAAGDRAVGRVDEARLRCDAAISAPGGRNTTTIAPRTRREVLARDGHRCRAPGCGRTRFLEVHHLRPRSRGGGNEAANLITLCSACHRLHHRRE